MKAKKKLLWLVLAAMLAVCAVVGAVIVSAAEPDTGKNGEFNGSPAHVDENGNLYIDEINFPDEVFRNYILNGPFFSSLGYKPMDADGDNKLSVEEVSAVKTIDLAGHGYYDDTSKNIHDISGIEFFTSLEELSAHRQEIESVDVSKLKALKTLSVGDQSIKTIKLDNPELTDLNCSRNPLDEIDLSKLPKLQSLSVYNTRIKELDLSNNPDLTYLSCGLIGVTRNNREKYTSFTFIESWYWRSEDYWLTDIDISACTKLETVRIVAPLIEKIEFPNPDSLKDVIIVSTPISSLDLSGCNNLQYLSLLDTKIAKLDCSTCPAIREIIVNSVFSPSTAFGRWDTIVYDYDDGFDQISGAFLSDLNITGCDKLETLECSRNELTSLDLSTNTALKRLKCVTNKLTELDVSANTELDTLWCDDNKLTELDVSANTALTYLHCDNNQLTSLDVSANTELHTLWCSGNQLTELDVSANTALTWLDCSSNHLTELDVSPNTALMFLDCSRNKLTELDISRNTALTRLDISHNTAIKEINANYCSSLEEINVNYCSNLEDLDYFGSEHIKEIFCEECTGLTSLDLTMCAELETIDCRKSGITSLDLSACESLKSVECGGSEISEIITSEKTHLEKFNCDRCSNLKSLDFSGLSSLVELWASDNSLESVDVSDCENLKIVYMVNPTALTSLDVTNCKNIHQLTVMHGQLLYLDATGCNPDAISTDSNGLTQDYKKEVTVVKRADGKYELDLASLLGKFVEGVQVVQKVVETDGYTDWIEAEFDPKTGVAVFDTQPQKIRYEAYPYGFTDENLSTWCFLFNVNLDNIKCVDAPVEPPETEPEPPETEPDPPVTEPEPPVTEPEPPVTEPEPPVTEPEPPVTEPDPLVTETEPVVTELVDKDDDVTVQYPESDAAYYEDVKLVAELKKSDANDRVSYSIELIKNGTPIQPKSTITIKLPVPQGWDVSTIVVYYVDDNGNREKIPSSISSDGKYVVFTTDHLSIYELATETAAPAETTAAPAETTAAPTETTGAPAETTTPTTGTTTTPPKTGDTNVITIVVAAMCTCAAAAAVALGTKKRR